MKWLKKAWITLTVVTTLAAAVAIYAAVDLQYQVHDVVDQSNEAFVRQSKAIDDLTKRNDELQAQIDTKAPYPVALAERVFTIEAQLKEANKRSDSLSQELSDIRKRQNGFEQTLVDDIVFGRDPLIKLKNAQDQLTAGHTETARSLTVNAISDLVGRQNISCRATPVTEPFLVSYVMPKENIAKMLEGSGYVIHEVGANSYGAETLRFRADGYINAC